METENTVVEKRKNKRFKLKESAYAIVNYKPSKMAQIVDISRLGIAIHFTNNGEDSKDSYELDIFRPDFSFYLDKITTKVVWEQAVEGKNSSQLKETGQCGMEFTNLSANQIPQLENFIQNYAIASHD